MLDANPPVAHHLSQILKIYQIITNILRMFLSITWKFFSIWLQNLTGRETAYSRLCTGKICKPTKVEKTDRSSCVGVEKDP